jgi:hypothetical protein
LCAGDAGKELGCGVSALIGFLSASGLFSPLTPEVVDSEEDLQWYAGRENVRNDHLLFTQDKAGRGGATARK